MSPHFASCRLISPHFASPWYDFTPPFARNKRADSCFCPRGVVWGSGSRRLYVLDRRLGSERRRPEVPGGFAGQGHRCPFWLFWSKNRWHWFAYWHWLTCWFNHLPGPSISPKRTPMVLVFSSLPPFRPIRFLRWVFSQGALIWREHVEAKTSALDGPLVSWVFPTFRSHFRARISLAERG